MNSKFIYILCLIFWFVIFVLPVYASNTGNHKGYDTGTLTEIMFDIVDASQKGSVKVKTIALEILAGMFGIAVLWLILKFIASPANNCLWSRIYS